MKTPFALLAALLWSIVPAFSGEPVVRMLVPGFTVHELPLKIPNINNLRFAPDGRLTALGYNGQIYMLRDSNGDGLEDQVDAFWEKPTLSVPVGMAWAAEGLYVSSKGKISLIRDLNRDGKGDTEETIASGWPPTDVGSGGVDATAVTLDRDGNLYFGLLVADYSNAYRIKDGISHYDLRSPRGTIQKWNRRTKTLETIATGIRVPYTLAFNRLGDLFLTDQEGETWMPSGNPFDELNHILPGRNYGFPPRHPKWLPDLISEPPVVAFGPQHQSTCGFVFNEPQRKTASTPGQKPFGPQWWEGDAFVTGESRGKLWRVRLVKTPYGYIGREHLIARLSMLTTDVAISPSGELYVSCHSGPPDWGTGPQGEGKLFKITYTDRAMPQPIMSWQANMGEARVAFDKPIHPSITNHIQEMRLEAGAHVSAGDRFEVLKPPYDVVKRQDAAPRHTIPIKAVKLLEDGKVLALETEPSLRRAQRYALTIPGLQPESSPSSPATIDLEFDATGAEMVLRAEMGIARLPVIGGKANELARKAGFKTPRPELIYDGWLPTPDLAAAKELARPYEPIARAYEALSGGNKEYLRISFNMPKQAARLHATGPAPFLISAIAGTNQHREAVIAERQASGEYSAILTLQPEKASADNGRYHEIEIGGYPPGSPKAPLVQLAYSTETDSTLRPLSPSLTFLEGAHHPQPDAGTTNESHFKVGDWQTGKSLFFSKELQCGTCHRIRDEGGMIGPDLSNLVHRDVGSILRDIQEPGAAIHPDYVTYQVTTSDGESVTGFVGAQEAHTIQLIGGDGKRMDLKREDVKEFKPSGLSLMPAGLLDHKKEREIRDLLTFLMHEPPRRGLADLEQITPAAKTDSKQNTLPKNGQLRPLHLVLVASEQDHGPGEHDYPAWQKKWQRLFRSLPNVDVTTAWEWPSQEQFDRADVLVFYYWNHHWNAARYQQFDAFQSRGGGVALFHAATISDREPDELAKRIGLAAQPGRTDYLHCPFDLDIVPSADHKITAGLPRTIRLLDEPYWPMIGDESNIEVLATTEMDGKARPMVWTFQRGQSRVFGSIPGHYTWTFDDPLFRLIALRGIAWAANEEADRFISLAKEELANESAEKK